MFKNGVIAVLLTIQIMQQAAYEPHRQLIVFLAIAAALFIAVSIIEDEVDKYKRAKYRQRKFQKQVDDIQLQKGGKSA